MRAPVGIVLASEGRKFRGQNPVSKVQNPLDPSDAGSIITILPNSRTLRRSHAQLVHFPPPGFPIHSRTRIEAIDLQFDKAPQLGYSFVGIGPQARYPPPNRTRG